MAVALRLAHAVHRWGDPLFWLVVDLHDIFLGVPGGADKRVLSAS